MNSHFFRLCRLWNWFLLAAFVLSASGFARQQEITATTTLPKENQPAESESEDPSSWRYLLHLPRGYEGSEERWPLLLYLHGRSARGTDFDQVRRYGPPSFLNRRPGFPFVVVSPQLPDGSWPASSLLELLDELLAEYRIDPNRIYLTGVSLGAGGAWYLAASAPERFAAFAPVCGYGHPSIAKKMTGLPIWGFHGSDDQITPLANHRKLIEAVQANGGMAELTVIPGGTHGSVIVPTYRRQDLYDWFLSNRRDQPNPPPAQPKPEPDPEPKPEATDATEEKMPRAPLKARPIGPSTGKPSRKHTVKSGDTLWGLGKQHDVSIESLKQTNSLISDTIYVGQVLKIPDADADPQP